jgi:hypothetical protein
MLGLPSRAVGAKMTSAFLIRFIALSVSSSGSPGPHPTQNSFIHIFSNERCYLKDDNHLLNYMHLFTKLAKLSKDYSILTKRNFLTKH